MSRSHPVSIAARLAVVGMLVTTGCAGPAAPTATPTAPLPTATAGIPAGFYLRAWLTQALPPRSAFTMVPVLTVAAGVLIEGNVAVPAIYPAPLLLQLIGHTVTDAGNAAIVDEARREGLLDAVTDFTGGTMAPGAQLAHIEIVVDGRDRLLFGDPTRIVRCGATRCIPQPGTPEAFAAFWARFADMAGWLGPEVGPSAPYDPVRLAILAVAPEAAGAPIQPGRAAWPLDRPFAIWGDAFGGSATDRCGTVSGDDLARLLPALRTANALTRFVDAAGAERSLVVRPLVPGEMDPCVPGV
jgi:hypothetical protein